MCGINGFNFQDKKKIQEMNESIKHRGPDDNGFFCSKDITLGQVRLSILDLSDAGHQPMFYSPKHGACSEKYHKEFIFYSHVSITYNGEIYNYLEIKSDLEEKGYKFSTKTDTEVILAAYLEYGEDCVNHFNGMWAFCIYDKSKNIFFCSRDILGQKPLFYFYDNEKFIFSSELKGILDHRLDLEIDERGKDLYLSLGFIPSPYSIYKNVYKLEARHNLIFDLNTKKLKKYQYYKLPKYNPCFDKDKLIEEGRKLLEDAVKIRMVADVPVGAFLSGGLDSSSVVSMMKHMSTSESNNLHTFSIGFHSKKFDETEYIEIARKNFKTKHHHEYFELEEFDNLLPDITKYFDEPFSDSALFPNFKVAKLARKSVTVSLTGDGGDEVFGGYTKHQLAVKLELFRKVPKILRKLGFDILNKVKKKSDFTILGKIRELFRWSLTPKEDFWIEMYSGNKYIGNNYKKWSREKMKEMLEISGGDLREAVIKYDLFYNTLSDNFLTKVDRTSMATSLECRSPFLDKRFIEFSAKIPSEWKCDLFNKKILVSKIVSGLIPESLIKRRKQGFSPPVLNERIFNDWRGDIEQSINVSSLIDTETKKYYIDILNNEDKIDSNYWAIIIFRIYLLCKWQERYEKK